MARQPLTIPSMITPQATRVTLLGRSPGRLLSGAFAISAKLYAKQLPAQISVHQSDYMLAPDMILNALFVNDLCRESHPSISSLSINLGPILSIRTVKYVTLELDDSLSQVPSE
jgi:hypothetical protein